MPEMLTIKQTLEKIKEEYPETIIGEHALRGWIKEKKFHFVKTGVKFLISWQSFTAFLCGEGQNKNGKE